MKKVVFSVLTLLACVAVADAHHRARGFRAGFRGGFHNVHAFRAVRVASFSHGYGYSGYSAAVVAAPVVAAPVVAPVAAPDCCQGNLAELQALKTYTPAVSAVVAPHAATVVPRGY